MCGYALKQFKKLKYFSKAAPNLHSDIQYQNDGNKIRVGIGGNVDTNDRKPGEYLTRSFMSFKLIT